MKRILICLLSLLTMGSVCAQEIKVKSLEQILEVENSDSTLRMSLRSFIEIVVKNHPVIKQADLLPENAKQEVRLAKGTFDPKLEVSWDVKNFDNKEYYDIFNTTLKVPTWFPIDPKISIDRNRGVFLNPQSSIPAADNFRQVTAGLSLPIGRGLIIDQRRAAVKQAEIFGQITNAERVKMINKVLLSAAKDYWSWYFAFYNFRLIEESLNISQEIYRRVKVDFQYGEVAAMDTIQATITLQNRQVERQSALMEFRLASIALSNYLWGENEEPLELKDNLLPELSSVDQTILSESDLQNLLNLALKEHPDLEKTNLKLDQLGIDERLAKENLKPRLDLNYNLINAPINGSGDFIDVQLRNNYKFGVSFEFPLFLRKERSKLKQTRIKIEQTKYELSRLEREVVNRIQAWFFELGTTNDMLEQMQNAVNNYKALLNAELFNLQNGESDLFKINFQQDKLLETQVKLMKLMSDMEKAKVNLYWSAGIPYLNF